MVKLSIVTYVLGLVLSVFMMTSVAAQTVSPSPTPVTPTSPPSTGHGVK